MNNSLYFEFIGEASDLKAIPQAIKLIMISCKKKKTKSGTSTKYQFYGISTTACFDLGSCEIKSMRIRAAAPAIIRDFLAIANINDPKLRAMYDEESN